MSNASAILRSLLVYGLCLPLAIFIGYLLADPYDRTNLTTVGVVLFLLTVPLLLKWHHSWLIAVWNTNMIFMFLPGQPPAWMLLSLLSFTIASTQYILNRRIKFVSVPSITRPLIFLAVVVFVTAKLTGGIGMRVFGGESQGGKRYLLVFGAILGYFAMTSRRIPLNKRWLFTAIFFMGTLTFVISTLAVTNNPIFYPLFLFFPPDVGSLAAEPTLTGGHGITRLGGLAGATIALVYVMLARYGVKEIFTLRRLVRLGLFCLFAFMTLFGGFRSLFVQMVLVFCIVFYLEGLMRSRLMPALVLLSVLIFTFSLPFISRMPLNVQRSLSIVPLLPIDPTAQDDAATSSDWRVQMWRHVIPQIPQYLLIGKGYSINIHDAELISSFGSESGTSGAELAGDYHNGPLSVILPFGIFGVIGFLWFLVASFRVLQYNYLYGDPDCRRINRLLLAYFIARVIIFFVVFGSLHSDLVAFTGLVAFSVCLNGGMAAQPDVISKPTLARFRMPTRKKSVATA